ncbi:MAG: hypothetical protein FH748_16635 [Balneolaceae bacterium]|nr:hypothetical protein [Balneolaceae bacterium]
MSINARELKKLLHESTENIDDGVFLQMVKDILDHKYEPGEVRLTSYQENRIEEAKKSINQGEALTNKQADQLVSKWLNE